MFNVRKEHTKSQQWDTYCCVHEWIVLWATVLKEEVWTVELLCSEVMCQKTEVMSKQDVLKWALIKYQKQNKKNTNWS